MTKLDFDELNKLGSKSKKKRYPQSIPYHDFFGKMYISVEQMNMRIDLAREIEGVMLYLFAYWLLKAETDIDLSVEEIKDKVKVELSTIVAKQLIIDAYLEEHINNVIDEVWETMDDHLEEIKEDNEDTESEGSYWTSNDRAKIIAENEANAFFNYSEYRDAKNSGKTKKTWHTELDDKVRMTHTLVEGKTIDIDGLFLVGDSQMRFPKDTEYDADPQETINCRCSCEYK